MYLTVGFRVVVIRHKNNIEPGVTFVETEEGVDVSDTRYAVSFH